MADIVAMPWQLAISEDSKWPVAEANYRVPQTAALLRPYFGAVARAAAQDTGGGWACALVCVGGGSGLASAASESPAMCAIESQLRSLPFPLSSFLAVFVEWAKILHMLAPPTAFFSPRMLLAAFHYGVLLPLLARLPWVGRRFGAVGAQAGAVAAAEQQS